MIEKETDPESEIGIGTEIETDDTEMTNTSHAGNSRLMIYILLYSYMSFIYTQVTPGL